MKKQTAIIVVSIFLLIVVAASIYIYQSNMQISPQEYTDAATAFQSNDSDEAILILENKKLKTQDERLLLAAAYLDRGSLNLNEREAFDKALPLLDAVLAEDNLNSEALRLKAYGYEIIENFEMAYDTYDRAIAVDTSNALAFSGKAHAKALQGEMSEATSLYKAALSIDPTLDHASLGLARIYIKEEINSKEAVVLLNNVIENSPNVRMRAEAEQILGAYYLSIDDLEKARQAFETSLSFDPSLAQAYVGMAQVKFSNLANVQVNEAYYDSIIKDLETATRLNSELTMGYYVAAVVFEYTGHNDIAQNLYKQALEVVDQDISLSVDEKLSLKGITEGNIKK